jgi:peptide/nickel transport system substrate-binding protein
MDNVASVEATDDKTVTITLTTAAPVFISQLASNNMSVVDSAVVMANGGSDAEDAATTDTAAAYLDAQSAGSGPYILDHWTKDTETVLTRNPNYWGEPAYFDRVIIQNIPEPATQKTALETGDIDIALDLTSDQMPSLEGNADITVASTPGNIIHFLIMNENPDIGGPVSNPQVQLAIRYALDYEGYKALWGGITPGTNMVVGFPDAFGEDKAFVRDVDKAKELLTEAGFPDGFEITLTYPTYSIQGVNMDTTAQKIVEDLAEVGIVVTLNPGEVSVALEGYRNGTDAFGYWFWGPDYLDSSDVLSFMPGEKVGLRAAWTAEMADQSILDMINEAKVASDPAQRTELFTALQDFLQQSGPFAPFIQPTVQTAFSSSLQGYHWHPQWIIDLAKLSRAE